MLPPSPPPNGPPPPGLVRSSAPGCENQPGALFLIRQEASAAGRERPAKPLSVREMIVAQEDPGHDQDRGRRIGKLHK
jgi:hypothetical protein